MSQGFRKPVKNVAGEVTTGNVLDELGFSPAHAAALKRKAVVWSALLDEIVAKKYTPKDLVSKLDEYQPQVSNLLSGKISKVSLEKLLEYCDRLGITVAIEVGAKQPEVVPFDRVLADFDMAKRTVGSAQHTFARRREYSGYKRSTIGKAAKSRDSKTHNSGRYAR